MATLMVLIVIASLAVAGEVPFWDNATLTEVDAWRDPGGEGADLRFDQSRDGQRLVMVGFGSPDEIRVVDREIQTLAVLSPPGNNSTVRGARWSFMDTWLVAWGRAEGADHDFLAAWNGITYEPYDGLFENDTAPLATVHAVIFQANEEILVIGGRDSSGTSRMLVFETSSMRKHRDTPYRDNITIQTLEYDGIALACIDLTGSITEVGGNAWGIERVLDGRPAIPTASSFPYGEMYPWLVGYEDGWLSLWSGGPKELELSLRAGEGPVEGLSWILNRTARYLLAAIHADGGGSTVGTYILPRKADLLVEVSDVIETSSSVTMMSTDRLDKNHVFTGLADGSLVLYEITLIPNLPPVITIEFPEVDQNLTEDFIIRGTYSDDNDDVIGMRVSFGDDEWHTVHMDNGSWSCKVNITSLPPGPTEIKARAHDSRHDNVTSRWIIIYHVEPPDDGDDGTSAPPNTLVYAVVIAAILLLLLLAWRLGRRPKESQVKNDEDTDGKEEM
jgi:hypothetical protein